MTKLNLGCGGNIFPGYINVGYEDGRPDSDIYLNVDLRWDEKMERMQDLPPYLTHLTIHNKYNHSLDDLPQSLIYLCLKEYEGVISDLPNTLKELYIYSYCHHYKINMLPESIEIL